MKGLKPRIYIPKTEKAVEGRFCADFGNGKKEGGAMSRLKTRLEERDGELVPVLATEKRRSDEIYDTRDEYELDREIMKETR